jgi:site-specific recombinase XerD
MGKTIDKHMLRKRAPKLPEVTPEMWGQVDSELRNLIEEFIDFQNFSPQTKTQYTSGLHQFAWYIHNSMNDKKLYKLTKRDMMRYLSFLKNHGMSSNGQKLKKASVSSFFNYIENVLADENINYKTFRNLTRGLPAIPKNIVYEKIKISKDDYELLMSTLLDDENYLGAAWVATAFNVGARRSEIIQFRTEILSYPISADDTYVMSHNVRLKGRGEDGKVEPYMINREALKYMDLWCKKRGYDHEYIFTTKSNGEEKQLSRQWADNFCTNVLSDILGRRINPHLFKASCVTYLLESGVQMELVSKYVAHHENVSTTQIYDLRDFSEEKNDIFK